MDISGFGSSLSGLFGGQESFLHPERGYQKAQQPLWESFQTAQRQAGEHMQPFEDYGKNQYGNLMNAENQLLDPETLLNKWIEKYSTSPYAQQLMNQSKASGLDAASSMGLSGSSAALSNVQQGAGNIMNADRQQYLNNLMDKYMKGVGIGENIYGIGAGVGTNLGKILSEQSQRYGENAAGLKFGETNAPGKSFESIMSAVAQVFGGMGKGAAM